MSKKSCLSEPFDTEHGKRAKALLKYASQHLYHIHWTLPDHVSWKMSLLFTCQTLGLLVKILAADEKYPVLNRDNLMRPIQMQLSQKQKTFSELLAEFLKYRLSFRYFERKYDLHRFCISRITASGNVIREMLKKSSSEVLLRSNMVKVPKHCWNLHHSTFTNLVITSKSTELEKVSVIDMPNLGTAC